MVIEYKKMFFSLCEWISAEYISGLWHYFYHLTGYYQIDGYCIQDLVIIFEKSGYATLNVNAVEELQEILMSPIGKFTLNTFF